MGLELELLPSQLPPIRTAAPAPRPDGDDNNTNAVVGDGGCATPKSAANALRAPSACPPAPRKPRPDKRRKLLRRGCGSGSAAPHPAAVPVRWLIAVPHDVLAAVFVARPAAAPCPTSSSPASKKIRLHVTG